MKLTKIKYVLGAFILALFLVQVNISQETTQEGIELSVVTLRAIAQSSDPEFEDGNCQSFGYRAWDVITATKSGYDCLCKARNKVKYDCG